MSVAFQEHLGQEEKSTSQNISQIPCPSSLLAAASTIKCIMDAADAERKQRAFRDAEGGHEQEGEIDCRWTAGGTASCGQEEEEQHYRRGEIRFHGEQQRPHQHPLHVHHKRTIPLQQRELALQREGGKFRAAKFMAIMLQRRCTCSNGWPPQVQERSRRRSQGDRSTFRSTVLHHKYSKRNVALRLLELVLLLLLLLLLEMLLFPGLPLLFLSLLPRATSSEYQSCTHRLPQHARLPASSPPRPTCAASS